MDKNIIIDILKRELVPALGCTEPVAVALCAASAYSAINGEIEKLVVKVSANIFKNGMSVGIPGIDMVGLKVAAALGAFGGNPELKLEVLSEVKKEEVERTEEFLKSGNISVEIENDMGNFYISCEVHTSNGKGVCIIINSHSNIVYIEKNGTVLFKKDEKVVFLKSQSDKLVEYKLMDLLAEINNMTFEELSFMLDGAKMNMKMAEVGLAESCGMEIGRTIKKSMESGLLSNDLYHNVVMMTAAGSDARMSGYFLPVMSSAGSGNHGLTAIIPVAVTANWLKAKDEKLCKALAMSHMTTIFVKLFTGRLSTMCGCGVAASTGASVGICYLLGGGKTEMENAIQNMIGDVSGIICDGAKAGCALKLSTAAGAALKAAILSTNNCVIPSDNGIVGATVEDTIKNLGRVSVEGMESTEKIILDIMLKKNMC
jgi:L-cysteine desulfidase